MGTPTSVYLYRDSRGLLLYVGITKQGPGRQDQHAASSRWWHYVASSEIEHHPTREAALERERQLIIEFCPPFNRQHNQRAEEVEWAYLTMFAPGDLRHDGPRILDSLRAELDELNLGLRVIGDSLWRFSVEHVADPKSGNERASAAYETTWLLSDMHQAVNDYPVEDVRAAMLAVLDRLFTDEWKAIAGLVYSETPEEGAG